MKNCLTVSEAAREMSRETGVEVHPRDISDLFYQRVLPDDAGPIIGGRRLIARETLPVILKALRDRGKVARPAGGPEVGPDFGKAGRGPQVDLARHGA